MQEWNIGLQVTLAPLDDPSAYACANQVPQLNLGTITLRADYEDSEWWEIVLVHELLHIKHSRVDTVLSDVIIPNCNDAGLAQAMYKTTVEPFIHALAEVLVRAYRPKMGTDALLAPKPIEPTGTTIRGSGDGHVVTEVRPGHFSYQDPSDSVGEIIYLYHES